MGTRGRPPVGELTVARVGAVLRLPAPHDLTDEETEIWVQIVNTEPADRFAPSHVPLLTQYVRHAVQARHCWSLRERVFADKSATLADHKMVLQMVAQESSALAMLATKLCLSPKSTTNHRGNKKPLLTHRPWDEQD